MFIYSVQQLVHTVNRYILHVVSSKTPLPELQIKFYGFEQSLAAQHELVMIDPPAGRWL